jgi:quinol-cytochrome oxidoreductase complex cytochrome b subunit
MSAPKSSRPGKIKSYPFLVNRELAAIAVCIAVLMMISVLFDAPLEGPADPNGAPTQNVKAPWIFLGVQQTLKWMPAEIAGLVIPILSVLVITLIPYIKLKLVPKTGLFVVIMVSVILLTVWGYVS